MAHKFPRGNKFAKGGKREGSGRPSNDFVAEFAARCRAALDKSKAIEYLQAVASGEKTETYVTELGHCIKVKASARDRRECIKLLMDRGLGMAAQSLEIGGRDGEPLQVNLIQYAPKEKD
jgi:hypothetical protein